MKSSMSFLLVMGLLLLAAPAQGAKKPKTNQSPIKNVVVLPPIVKMTKHGVKGAEGMGKDEEAARMEFSGSVPAALTKCDFSVQSPFTDEALKNNNDLKYAVADVQRKFDEIAPQLYKNKKDVPKGRFTLGDMVAVLNSKGTADALVIIRADGEEKTKGKGFMTGGLAGMASAGIPMFRSRLAVVDARNGNVLFLGDYRTQGVPSYKTFEKSLQKFSSPK